MKLNKLLYHIQEKEDRIPTFFDDIDKLTGGLLVGGITTIAGRPAMGKTAFAMSVVRNVGVMNKIPTAVLSLTDDERYTAKRLIASQLGWDAVKSMEQHSIKQTDRADHVVSNDGGEKSQEQNQIKLTDVQKEKIALLQKIGFETLKPQVGTPVYQNPEVDNSELDSTPAWLLFTWNKFLEKAKSAPVWIEHGLDMDMDEIVSRMERLKRENDIKLIVIDSFGWIAPESTLTASETAMQKLVHTAEKLKVAVFMTCDLTRAVENRGGTKKPMLSDLRDNALIEKYSSLVMFLYRPEYYSIFEDDLGSTLNMADVIIARNRRGDIGEVRLRFVNRAGFVSRPPVSVLFPYSNDEIVVTPKMNDDMF